MSNAIYEDIMAKGHKKTNLQYLPACAAGFIKLVIKKMRYRKKVRADVMAELAAHFEDELKDCKTDEEKEHRAEQLIAEFGDVKLLAILLRRAKKRCRPLWRKVLVRSFQALAVIVLYIIFVSLYLGTGTPNISVNYADWLNELVSKGSSEVQNAKPYYDKAAELCVKCPTALQEKCLGCGSAGNWLTDFNDLEMELFSKWMGDNKKALELVREGTNKPYCWPVYEATETDLTKGAIFNNTDVMRNLYYYRIIAQALAWRSQYKAYKTDVESGLRDCLILVRFSLHQQGRGLLVEQLVGLAIEALAHHRVFMILEKVNIPAKALRNTQKELENEYSKHRAVLTFEAEKAIWYDYVQKGFTDDGKGGGRVLKQGLPLVADDWKNALWRFLSFGYPDRHEVTETIERFFRCAAKLSTKTPWQTHSNGCEAETWKQISQKCALLRIQEPALRKAIEQSWAIETSRAALLAVLAVLRYEKERGKYPDSLQELVPAGYLKQLPMDPYSDKPLVYRKTDDGFMLYGLGSNFKDDGGQVVRDDKGRVKKWADEGDTVFWPVSK